MAFQIKDDLFDYGNEEIGKPLGIDIKEKKMTLPLIFSLTKATWLKKKEIIYIIRHQSNKPKKVAKVIEFVKKSGGIEYATEVMQKYHLQAQEVLSGFVDSTYKKSLSQLVTFTIDRQK